MGSLYKKMIKEKNILLSLLKKNPSLSKRELQSLDLILNTMAMIFEEQEKSLLSLMGSSR
jgi:hypothetical protein|tara:strand:+ start:1186 stop:1365 length:180 start_codon:yes stop_codon:yes gene_type:complete